MKLNIKGTIVPNDYKHVYDYFGIESTSAKDVSDALDAVNRWRCTSIPAAAMCRSATKFIPCCRNTAAV